jgi:hypothetical protein
MGDLKWFEGFNPGPRRAKWFFEGETCIPEAVGVDEVEGKVKSIRVCVGNKKIVVNRDIDGHFTGLMYDVEDGEA